MHRSVSPWDTRCLAVSIVLSRRFRTSAMGIMETICAGTTSTYGTQADAQAMLDNVLNGQEYVAAPTAHVPDTDAPHIATARVSVEPAGDTMPVKPATVAIDVSELCLSAHEHGDAIVQHAFSGSVAAAPDAPETRAQMRVEVMVKHPRRDEVASCGGPDTRKLRFIAAHEDLRYNASDGLHVMYLYHTRLFTPNGDPAQLLSGHKQSKVAICVRWGPHTGSFVTRSAWWCLQLLDWIRALMTAPMHERLREAVALKACQPGLCIDEFAGMGEPHRQQEDVGHGGLMDTRVRRVTFDVFHHRATSRDGRRDGNKLEYTADDIVTYRLLAEACPVPAVKHAMMRSVDGLIPRRVERYLQRQEGYGLRNCPKAEMVPRVLRQHGVTYVARELLYTALQLCRGALTWRVACGVSA